MSYVAIVTGASSGIGEATARRLAREPDIHVLLVARREEQLNALAAELGGPERATVLALDLVRKDSARRIRRHLEREHDGALHLLVNNAGASWRGRFGDVGWENIEQNMKLNFEAPVRLTEALLPLLRSTAAAQRDPAAENRRVAIVNVASTAGRVARPGSGAYSASKFALIGWSDSLYAEELAHGVHVGVVLPGFIRTEGFPASELRASPLTRRIVAEPPLVAEAIFEAGPGGRPERYVPRYYWLPAALRILVPRLIRRTVAGGTFSTASKHGS
jgi:short-subunit dehydrogenase